MKLRVYGTYRERTRINLWLFWITGPWKEKPFDTTWTAETGVDFSQNTGPVEIKGRLGPDSTGAWIGVGIAFAGVTLWDWRKKILSVGERRAFSLEPIKGMILKGTAEVLP